MDSPKMHPHFPVTTLPHNATPSQAIKTHWREYLMEAAELSALMLGICFSGTLIYSKASPLSIFPRMTEAFLMGSLVASVTLLIIRSPFGRRTGAHFNPALTFTYYCLGRIHRWDAMFYILSQFVGAVIGVSIADGVLGKHLAMPPVRYVITIPGNYGTIAAFITELLFAGIVMGLILFTTNRAHLINSTPFVVAVLTVFYYVFCSSLSGFSVNPARSFSSALFASVWDGIWIYFLAPCCGMLAAAFIYLQCPGNHRIYCAKVFHDATSSCPFRCEFMQLLCGKAFEEKLSR
jgi:aquaporin Z